MNQDPADNPLREKVWRGELSAPEQARLRAWLAAHPETQADWETEQELSRLLARLPDAPVPSNFTARVLQAVERAERTDKKSSATRPWWLQVLLPRAAVAIAVVGVGLFSYQRYQNNRRHQLADGLAPVAEVKTMPSVEGLEDFDVIRRLAPTSAADEGLLSLAADLQGLNP